MPDETYIQLYNFRERDEWERDNGHAGGGLVSDIAALCRLWDCDVWQVLKQLRADREAEQRQN